MCQDGTKIKNGERNRSLCHLTTKIFPIFIVIALIIIAIPVFADSNSLTFTNEATNQPDLYITKTVTAADSNTTIPDDVEFTFVIKWDLDGDGTLSYAKNEVYTVYEEDGTEVKNYENGYEVSFKTDSAGRFTLKAGQTAKFEYVGTNVEYEITEINLGENWTQTTPANGASASGLVDENGTMVTFENTYAASYEPEEDEEDPTTTLYVTKSTSDVFGDTWETTDTFTFTLLIADEPWANENYTIYDLSGNEVGTGITDDSGQFTLSGNQKAIFEDIPLYEDYSVTETVPDNWTCLTDTTVEGGTVYPGVYVYFTNEIDGGYLTLTKVNSQSDVLEGAVFGIYSDEYCTTMVAKMTSGEDGVATSRELNPGTYYVKEITAPKNYSLSDTVYTVTISSNETTEVGNGEIENTTKGGTISLTKTDEDDDTPLEGAVFGVYSDSDCNILVCQMETDDKGLATSSKLDLGTYYVKEITAPSGYLRSDTIYTVKISGSSGTVSVTDSGIITNTKERGSIKIVKKDDDGNVLSGVTFKLVSSDGNTVITLTTDKDGEVLFDDLYADTYTITETETVSGQSLLAEPFRVTIPLVLTEAEVLAQNADKNSAYVLDRKYYFYDLTYEVTNTVSLSLPQSGGMGFSVKMLITGLFVLLIAVWVFVMYKHSRKEPKK